MPVVAADFPDTPFFVTPLAGADSEGNPIPSAELTPNLESTNPDVVRVDNFDGSRGSLHFGVPGTAVLKLTTAYNGKVYPVSNLAIEVVPGELARIVGGELSIPGITDIIVSGDDTDTVVDPEEDDTIEQVFDPKA